MPTNSPQDQLRKDVAEWLDLELDQTCVAGDSFTRLAVEKKEDKLFFSSTTRGKKDVYLIATLGDTIEFEAPNRNLHQEIGSASYCIEKTLERY